jgi:hypothetical protein
MNHEKDNNEKPDKKETDQKLKEVHKVWGLAEAEVLKSYLESQGIPCYFQSKILHTVYPFTADGLGEIKIFVLEKDFEAARELLSEFA